VAAPLTAPASFLRASSSLDAFLFFSSPTYWIPYHPRLLCVFTPIQMAAVPFGFSFGDFVAAIEVIHKVTQALKRSSGARSHFHQTVADLESFETVLRSVEALSPTTSSPDAIGAIRLCAFKCHPPLNHFLQRIRFYEQHMGRPSGSKTQIVKSVTGSFWKAKWAIKIEQEVAKLKADIGPLLEAINVLLQIESRQQGAATHDAVKGLVDDVTSGFDRMMLAVQEQTLATRRIDLRITDMHLETQTVMQKLPQLATSAQLDGLLSMTESVSAKVGSTVTNDHTDQLTSLQQASSVTHMTTMAFAERQEIQTLQMGQKIQDVHSMLGAMKLSDRSHSQPTTKPTFDSPTSMPPPCRDPLGMPSHWSKPSKTADSGLYYRSQSHLLLSSMCRLLVSAVMALVLMFPNIQSQLRTFMTLLKSPSLLLSNSIMVTDALNRTKLLPYEYFCNWALFQPWLEGSFKDLPGESRVRRGDFAMFVPMRDRTAPVLRGEHWKRSVFPGDRVVMSMLSTRTFWDRCTRCGHVMSVQVATRDWIEW
jgi:hypothetical protein